MPMTNTTTIYVIARNNYGPEFYVGPPEDPSPWVENPIIARFSFHRSWMEDELESARAFHYPGIESAFIETVKVTCSIPPTDTDGA